ncbi:MAG: hypothetical protein HY720_22875 [Planctomycetes bacterium]|nr:hypothetical protein [Planctomycetota bacterium]
MASQSNIPEWNPNMQHVWCITAPCNPIFTPGSAAESVRQNIPTYTTLAIGEETNGWSSPGF